jgi:hypothetical protein
MRNPGEEIHGTSSTECDFVFRHQLQELAPRSVIDFGAGGGKTGRLVREILGRSCRLEAVEGFAPTARFLAESGIYDAVHQTLIQEWLKDHAIERHDLAIFGDVLEHLAPREVHRVLRRCLGMFQEVIVAAPLCDLSQGPLYGNPLEVHKTYITAGFFDRYRPIEKHIVHGDEWTIMNVRISARPLPRLRHGVLHRAYHASVLLLQTFGTAQPLVSFVRRAYRKTRLLLGR